MLRGKTGIVGVLLVLMLWISSTASAEPKMVRVFENVYTLLHGAGMDSNSTAIITKEGVIVVDTQVSPAEAKKLLSAIRERTDQPVRFVINTHFHGDYTFGNQVFRDTATIIAHKNLRRSLGDKSGLNHLTAFKAFNLPGLDEVKITVPNLVYEGSMELVLGGVRLQLLHLGQGHTDGDTAIFLPELRALIAGGLVYNQRIPYLGDAYIEDSIAFLSKLEELDAEIVIPGSGDIGGKPILIHMKHYLLTLRNNVQDQLEQKKTLQETKNAVRPILKEKYPDWERQELVDGNIERAYREYSESAELRGRGAQ